MSIFAQCWLWVTVSLAAPLHRQYDQDQVQVSLDHAGVMRRGTRGEEGEESVPRVASNQWRRPAANGTIAVLVKADNQSLSMLRSVLVPSLMSNVRFQTPVTIMFEGDQQLVEDATKRLHGHSLLWPLRFVDVTSLLTPSKEEIAILAGPDARMKDYGMGYRKMCEFWAAHVHTLPSLAEYQYIWRLDADSKITEPVRVNLYEVMQARNSVFGYLLLQKAAPEACQGLQKATEDFLKGEPALETASTDAETFLHNFEARRCPHWNTNFQIMDLDFFRTSFAHHRYMKHLTENLHGFVKYRWGDHTVQTLSVLLQVPQRRTLCMQPWVPGYDHQGKQPNCDPSISEPVLVAEVAEVVKVAASVIPVNEFLPFASVFGSFVCVICLGGAAWFLVNMKSRGALLSWSRSFLTKVKKHRAILLKDATESPREAVETDMQQVQGASALLDARLETMVNYLELQGEHAKPEVRAIVYNHVKAAMTWKSQERAAKDFHHKAEELDKAMMEITQKI